MFFLGAFARGAAVARRARMWYNSQMIENKKISVVVVAAGVGERFGGDKLLESIQDQPVLVTILNKFLLPEVDEIIVACHPQKIAIYQDLIAKHLSDARIRLIVGGSERWQSSLAGIKETSGEIVAIHDAARPLVRVETIRESLRVAVKTGAALVAAPATDSIKVVRDGENVQALNRREIYLAQTPQVFARELILEAYARAAAANFQEMTDESELITRFMERSVNVVVSDNRNLKITYPGDMEVVRLWASQET